MEDGASSCASWSLPQTSCAASQKLLSVTSRLRPAAPQLGHRGKPTAACNGVSYPLPVQPLLQDQGDNFLRSGSMRRSLSLVPEEQELSRPPLRRTTSAMGDDVEGRAHFRSLLLGELNRIANFYDQKVVLGHIIQHAAAVPCSWPHCRCSGRCSAAAGAGGVGPGQPGHREDPFRRDPRWAHVLAAGCHQGSLASRMLLTRLVQLPGARPDLAPAGCGV